MLPADRRLTLGKDFRRVLSQGRRAGRPLLTVHLLVDGVAPSPARAGLVVSKAVGCSVVRHRTSRRLRHLLVDRIPQLPPGSRLVVRAAPAAGSATSQDLSVDLDRALGRLLPAAVAG